MDAEIPASNEQEIERLSAFLMQFEKEVSVLDASEFSVEKLRAKWSRVTRRLDERSAFLNHLDQKLPNVRSLVAEANVIARDFQQDLFFRVILRVPMAFLKPSERVRWAC